MSDRTIFARALPEAVRITETYRYQQIIARNPVQDSVGAPQGELKVTVAYDGQRSFTRQAWLDARGQGLKEGKDGQDQQALIGHLALANTSRTRLAEALDLHGQFNTAPIQIPVADAMLERLGDLVDGQHAWEAAVAYEVDEPPTWPIRLTLLVRDEKSAGSQLEAADTHSPSISTQDLAAAIARHLTTRQDLSLLLRVRVDLPDAGDAAVAPVVSKVRVGWPRFTSLRSFRLENEDNPQEPFDYRFDAVSRSLEWFKVPMTPAKNVTTTGLRAFFSPAMALTIELPSDLYVEIPRDEQSSGPPGAQSEMLAGDVEVEVAGLLLSGLQARLFDGTGRLVDKPPLHLKTLLKTSYQVNLDDVFAKRTLWPRQRLYFDQVIPDDLRVLDVKTALADRGFRVDDRGRIDVEGSDFGHLLQAQRAEGPDKLVLVVLIEGKQYATRRETQIPGRQRYTSVFESGEITIHMAGELPGNSQKLIHEMNVVQQDLRARFNRVRANR